MKQAYVSILIVSRKTEPTLDEIYQIDSFLSQVTRSHEIVLVKNSINQSNDYARLPLSGPLTVVHTQRDASIDQMTFAGLGRTVGDFVIEWTLDAAELSSQIVEDLLNPTNDGAEIVQGVPVKNPQISKLFYGLTNKLRPASEPVRRSLATVYSRRALNRVLEANQIESNLMILIAGIPFQKFTQKIIASSINRRSISERLQEGLALLFKGSRFGTVVPLVLAGLSSLIAIGIAAYALVVYILFENVLEGWTSLAIMIGLGQGAILAMIGLVWARLDSLAKGLADRRDASSNVEVFPSQF